MRRRAMFSPRRIAAGIILLLCLAATASAAGDYLTQYRDRVSDAAAEAAVQAEPIADLTGEELDIYRLGFAAGYDFAAGESGLVTRAMPGGEEKTYVVNTHTDRFHVPSCSSVKEIKEGNEYTYVGDRQLLIDLGFTPCKKCNP